jgi:hypothetical protein
MHQAATVFIFPEINFSVEILNVRNNLIISRVKSILNLVLVAHIAKSNPKLIILEVSTLNLAILV